MVTAENRLQVALNVSRYLAVASTIAIALYYLPNYYLYEKIVAENSAALMQFIGIKPTVWTHGNQVFLNQFEIQRMCTGVQVIAVFLGLIVAVPKVPLKSRILCVQRCRGNRTLSQRRKDRVGDLARLQWDLAMVPCALSDWIDTGSLLSCSPDCCRRLFHSADRRLGVFID